MRALGERSWKTYKEVVRRVRGWGEAKLQRVPRRWPSALEVLEVRALMATEGYDYVLSGASWANPSRITYSIAPDGVQWISGTNGINSAFNAKFGAGVWQREIARALATWQASANINIVPVLDGAYPENMPGAQQGDSRFGDIRIGGDVLVNDTQTLAQTYYPPPMGSTAGGDVEINLGMSYSIGTQYDLYSVVLHETGHALGLAHTPNDQEVMRPVYGGEVGGLDDGDIAGIQAIYGARKLDVYQNAGYGLSAAKPIDLSPAVQTTQTSTAYGASLTAIGDVEWFSFVAPSYASGSWQVIASASNVSMLSPLVKVFDENGTLLGQASDASKWSNDAKASMGSIVAGHRYYVAVTGATRDVFSVGAYSLTVSMSKAPQVSTPVTSTPSPVVTSPTTTPVTSTPSGPIYTPVVVSADRFESNNTTSRATKLGKTVSTTIASLTLTTGDVDYYSFQAGAAGVYQVSAPGTVVQILNGRGRVVAQGSGSARTNAPRNSSLIVRIQSSDGSSVASYSLSISKSATTVRRTARQEASPALTARAAADAWALALRSATA